MAKRILPHYIKENKENLNTTTIEENINHHEKINYPTLQKIKGRLLNILDSS